MSLLQGSLQCVELGDLRFLFIVVIVVGVRKCWTRVRHEGRVVIEIARLFLFVCVRVEKRTSSETKRGSAKKRV